VRTSSGLSGAEAAARMLRSAGLETQVAIQRVSGFLSDHYDPRHKVLRLSPEVHDGQSLASVGVACHEAGHAIQDATHYVPLTLRNAIVPTASLGSNLAFGLIFIGVIFQFLRPLAIVGVLLFGAVVVFQFVNLPVEFNASTRAKAQLRELGIINGPAEAAGVSTMLNAAAMTYVAATVAALLNLMYYAMLVFGNRR
jgi:Zn-dependent membrane protease YugP